MVTYKLKRIKDLAIEKGLSIAKIGRDCGFPNNSTLHMMINRNSGDLTKVFKVASYLNVDIGNPNKGNHVVFWSQDGKEFPEIHQGKAV